MTALNCYETLIDQLSLELPIVEAPLLDKYNTEGLFRNGRIYIEKNLPLRKKKEVLSEEFSHYRTSVGNIIDYANPQNRKQEIQARRDSIERLVSLDDLLECYKCGCRSKYECAEFLEVTEPFFADTLRHYFAKYGSFYIHKDHLYVFDLDSLVIFPTNDNNYYKEENKGNNNYFFLTDFK